MLSHRTSCGPDRVPPSSTVPVLGGGGLPTALSEVGSDATLGEPGLEGWRGNGVSVHVNHVDVPIVQMVKAEAAGAQGAFAGVQTICLSFLVYTPTFYETGGPGSGSRSEVAGGTWNAD